MITNKLSKQRLLNCLINSKENIIELINIHEQNKALARLYERELGEIEFIISEIKSHD